MNKSARLCKWLTEQIGRPYRWAAKGPDAFDCSGLVAAAFAQVGIDLPHGSFNQAKCGREIKPADAHEGCLVFKKRKTTGAIYHVGVIVWADNVIHAKGRKWGVVEEPFYLSQWQLCRKVDALYVDA